MEKTVRLHQKGRVFTGLLKVFKGTLELSSDFGTIIKTGHFNFYILKDLRTDLEGIGTLILVNGSRRDVFPSGMTLASNTAYIHRMGKHTAMNDIVNLFDECTDLSIISSVEEQDSYHSRWLRSLESL